MSHTDSSIDWTEGHPYTPRTLRALHWLLLKTLHQMHNSRQQKEWLSYSENLMCPSPLQSIAISSSTTTVSLHSIWQHTRPCFPILIFGEPLLPFSTSLTTQFSLRFTAQIPKLTSGIIRIINWFPEFTKLLSGEWSPSQAWCLPTLYTAQYNLRNILYIAVSFNLNCKFTFLHRLCKPRYLILTHSKM